MGEATNFYTPDKASIEQLKTILANRSKSDVTFEEAEEVGIQLVSLYECLVRKHGDKGCGDAIAE